MENIEIEKISFLFTKNKNYMDSMLHFTAFLSHLFILVQVKIFALSNEFYGFSGRVKVK